mgnify:CR=1 FL=1
MKASITLLVFISLFRLNAYSQNGIDSLESLLQDKSLHDTTRCIVLGDLSREYRFTDTEKSLYYGKLELDIAKTAMPKQVPFALYHIGYAYYFLELNDSALHYFNECDEILGEHARGELKATLQGGLSQVYAKYGMYNKQIDYPLKGVEITRSLSKGTTRDFIRIGRSYLNLGTTYLGIDHNNEARLYYDKATESLTLGGDSIGLMKVYTSIAMLFQNTQKYDSADFYLQQALQVGKNYEGTEFYAEVYQVLAAINIEQMKLDQALHYTREALKNEMDQSLLMAIYRDMGVIYLNKKQYALSREYLNKSLAIAQELDLDDLKEDAYINLYLLDSVTNNYRSALTNFRNYHSLHLKLNSTAKFKEIGQIETRYRINDELKEKERMKMAALEVEREKQLWLRKILYRGVTALMVILIAIILSLKYLRNRSSLTATLTLVATLLVLEFLLIVTEPYTEAMSSGNPVVKLVLNFGIALMLVPIDKIINRLLAYRRDAYATRA